MPGTLTRLYKTGMMGNYDLMDKFQCDTCLEVITLKLCGKGGSRMANLPSNVCFLCMAMENTPTPKITKEEIILRKNEIKKRLDINE